MKALLNFILTTLVLLQLPQSSIFSQNQSYHFQWAGIDSNFLFLQNMEIKTPAQSDDTNITFKNDLSSFFITPSKEHSKNSLLQTSIDSIDTLRTARNVRDFPIVSKNIVSANNVQLNATESIGSEDSIFLFNHFSAVYLNDITSLRTILYSNWELNVNIQNAEVSDLCIVASSTLNLQLRSVECRSITIHSSMLNSLAIDKSAIARFTMSNCSITSPISFSGSLPDTICFYDIKFGGNGTIDLTHLIPTNHRIAISFYNCDISKIKLDYTYFVLVEPKIDTTDNFSKNLFSIVQKNFFDLAQNQANNANALKFLDIDHRIYNNSQTRIGKIATTLNRWWSNFGYEKDRIVGNTFFLFMLFYFINLMLYRSLIYDGYCIGEFQRAYERTIKKYRTTSGKKYLIILTRCCLYTGYIFFGLKLNIEKIKLNNILLVVIVILQYCIGIICLAYLANLIITQNL